MPFYQHYYTSFVNPATREGGFRTMAESPGLDPAAETALKRLVAYRVPPSCDDRDLQGHPVALRYMTLGPDARVLLCARSSGTDENGRPGNFFCHSLVFRTGDLGSAAPVDFWRDPLWRMEGSPGITTLPVFPGLDPPGASPLDAVWQFLDSDPRRREWFLHLLAAVVESSSENRRIVILDAADDVACWVAALSRALPPSLVASLTFSTYDYDPYQAPYLITGTTRDSLFRFSPLEFQQYFLLDAEQGRISENKPGPYATFVAERFTLARYSDELQPFFDFCGRRLAGDAAISRRLDTLATLFGVLARDDWSIVTADEVAALRTALSWFEATPPQGDDDVADLTLVVGCLKTALAGMPVAAHVLDLRRALDLGRRYDPSFALGLHGDLEVVAGFLAAAHQTEATETLTILDEAYGAERVSEAMSESSYLAELAGRVRGDTDAISAAWGAIGGHLRWGPGPNPLLDETLSALEARAADPSQRDSAGRLLGVLASLRSLEWREGLLASAVAARAGAPSTQPLSWVYYALVHDLRPAGRSPLRSIVRPALPEVEIFEMEEDLNSADLASSLRIIREWLPLLHGRPLLEIAALSRVVRALFDRTPQSARRELALGVLREPDVAMCLDTETEAALVEVGFSRIRVHALTEDELKVFTRFLGHPSLDADTQGRMRVCIALAKGDLDRSSIGFLSRRLAALAPEEYRAEIDLLFGRLLPVDVHSNVYADVVLATYSVGHHAAFWEVHWRWFDELLGGDEHAHQAGRLGLGRARPNDKRIDISAAWLVDFLTFWFEEAPQRLSERPYLIQGFFLTLPEALKAAGQTPAWNDLMRRLEQQAGSARWYPVFASIAPRRGGTSRLPRR